MPTLAVNPGGKGGPNIQAPFGQMAGRSFGGGLGGYGGMSQFTGRKRPWLGGFIGQDQGTIGGGPQLPNPFTGGFGNIAGNVLGRISGHQPGVGDRNPIPGWPGDNPISDGQGGMGPRQLINYQGLPGFNSFQDSFPPGPIAGRRRIDMDPGQYGQGLQYKDPAMLQQLSNTTMSMRGAGVYGRGRMSGGQGYSESAPGDALRRLLMARLGGGGL